MLGAMLPALLREQDHLLPIDLCLRKHLPLIMVNELRMKTPNPQLLTTIKGMMFA
jgi:hypothetical protein